MNALRSNSFLPILGRLLWMLLGPLALGVFAITIIKTGNGWITGADIAFLLVLGLMLLGRWLEFQGGNPQTADGQPATRQHLVRYLFFGATAGLGLWVLANLFGNYWWTS